MKRVLIIGGVATLLYITMSYQYLNSLLINVEKAEDEIVINVDRQQYLLESLTNVLYEISKYNYEITVSENKSDSIEDIKKDIKETRLELIELNGKVDTLMQNLESCSNRMAVARKRLSDAVCFYQKARKSILFYPVVFMFKFEEVEEKTMVDLKPLALLLYSGKE